MNALDALNHALFLSINADPATAAWQIQVALLLANRLILFVPGALVAMWLWGGQAQRSLALKVLASIGAALFISYLCGALWPHR
jgi:undecaprenyl-diphosphatase